MWLEYKRYLPCAEVLLPEITASHVPWARSFPFDIPERCILNKSSTIQPLGKCIYFIVLTAEIDVSNTYSVRTADEIA